VKDEGYKKKTPQEKHAVEEKSSDGIPWAISADDGSP
jgi:hypothetical protein